MAFPIPRSTPPVPDESRCPVHPMISGACDWCAKPKRRVSPVKIRRDIAEELRADAAWGGKPKLYRYLGRVLRRCVRREQQFGPRARCNVCPGCEYFERERASRCS